MILKIIINHSQNAVVPHLKSNHPAHRKRAIIIPKFWTNGNDIVQAQNTFFNTKYLVKKLIYQVNSR